MVMGLPSHHLGHILWPASCRLYLPSGGRDYIRARLTGGSVRVCWPFSPCPLFNLLEYLGCLTGGVSSVYILLITHTVQFNLLLRRLHFWQTGSWAQSADRALVGSLRPHSRRQCGLPSAGTPCLAASLMVMLAVVAAQCLYQLIHRG